MNCLERTPGSSSAGLRDEEPRVPPHQLPLPPMNRLERAPGSTESPTTESVAKRGEGEEMGERDDCSATGASPKNTNSVGTWVGPAGQRDNERAHRWELTKHLPALHPPINAAKIRVLPDKKTHKQQIGIL